MRATLVRTALATATLAGALGLTACTTSSAPDAQAQRNDAVQELHAARQAALLPLGTQLELLDRAELRAQLAGDQAQAGDTASTIAGYQELAAAIEAAPSAATVRALVDRSGVALVSTATPDPRG